MSVVLTTVEAFRVHWRPARRQGSTMQIRHVHNAGSTTLWSEDGELADVPDIRLFKHVLNESSGSDGIENVLGSGSIDNFTIAAADVLFTIHQIAPLPSTTENCPIEPFFVAPCVQFYNAEEESWCLPIRGGFVDLWLDSDILGESMSSGSTATSTNVAISNNEATTNISGTAIVLVVLFILLGVTIEITAKRITYDSLSFDKLITRGANGEVWRGTCGSQIVAIKQLLPKKRHDEGNIMLFSNEVRLASTLEHPNIVHFIGLSWNRVCDLCIVSEFMEQGDLSMLLNSNRKDDLTCFEPSQRPNALEIVFALRNIARNMNFDPNL
ncbi:unnamed protein product [Peronospora destructor]|uniref:Protein kinase domain-containing protein n=1 Tax=Peronospora destructor TaxID=86335 RepID=A0AAV0UUC7_9STRA|nr:unnamed protein product [Peronospora destructor]